MTKQLTIDFDAAASEVALSKAIERVAVGAGADWMAKADAAIASVARRQAEFTTDDVWALLDQPPNDPRALGAAMRSAVARGVCSPTGRVVKSQRVACHRRPLAVWASRVYAAR